MYSVLATMVHEILHVAQIEEQFCYRLQDQVCMHLGFLSNWSGWVIYVFNLSIILYLVVVVYQQLRGASWATVNGGNGNGNGNGNGKGSSKLQATIVVQLKMEEIYGWYGP